MDDLQEQVDRYVNTSQKLIDTLDRYSSNISTGNNASTISINAGGIGVLITSCLASFMCGVCIFLALQVWHQQKQMDDLHDYLNVIYQYAPNLKPKDYKP